MADCPPVQPFGKVAALKYLAMGPDERVKLGPDECADAAVSLAQYAAYLQGLAQRAEAEVLVLNDRIDALVSQQAARLVASSFAERRRLAILGHKEASELHAYCKLAEAKAKSLAYMANRLDRIGQTYENLSHVRRRDREYAN